MEPETKNNTKIHSLRKHSRANAALRILIIGLLLLAGLLILFAFFNTGEITLLIFSLILMFLGILLIFAIRRERKKVPKDSKHNTATGIGLAHLSNFLDNLWK